MSKKKKFKKQLKAQIFQQLQNATIKETIPNKTIENTPKTKEIKDVIQPIAAAKPQAQTNEFAYVTQDVKKIAIIFAICVVILLAIYYLGLKTNYIIDISNWLAKALHIS